MRTLFTVLALTACSSGPPDDDGTEAVLAEYEAQVEALRALADDHAASVDAAADLAAVDALEATFLADWPTTAEGLHHALDELEGCEMGDDDMQMMDDASAAMGTMDDLVDDHVASHDGHAELSDCAADEASLATSLGGVLDDMAGHHEHWHESTDVHCGMHMDDEH